MKATKYVVLGCGLVGLVCLFLPFIQFKGVGGEAKASAFQLLGGLCAVEEQAEKAGEKAKSQPDSKVTKALSERADTAKRTASCGSLSLVLMFVPALLLAALGGVSLMGNFGRVFASCALVFSLFGAMMCVLFIMATNNIQTYVESPFGLGFTLLLITYAAALLASLVGVIVPEGSTSAKAETLNVSPAISA
jgi:hypothetical protein